MYRNEKKLNAKRGGLQGDVGMVKTSLTAIPKRRAKNLNTRFIALGEQTGHHHALPPNCETYEVALIDVQDDPAIDADALRALFGPDATITLAVVPDEAELQHQEHYTQVYPPGIYWVTRQYEFPMGEPRRVAD